MLFCNVHDGSKRFFDALQHASLDGVSAARMVFQHRGGTANRHDACPQGRYYVHFSKVARSMMQCCRMSLSKINSKSCVVMLICLTR